MESTLFNSYFIRLIMICYPTFYNCLYREVSSKEHKPPSIYRIMCGCITFFVTSEAIRHWFSRVTWSLMKIIAKSPHDYFSSYTWYIAALGRFKYADELIKSKMANEIPYRWFSALKLSPSCNYDIGNGIFRLDFWSFYADDSSHVSKVLPALELWSLLS